MALCILRANESLPFQRAAGPLAGALLPRRVVAGETPVGPNTRPACKHCWGLDSDWRRSTPLLCARDL
jgi:hypothetical protein